MAKAIFTFVLILAEFLSTCTHAQKKDFQALNGLYLGQKPPGKKPCLFAPEIMNAEMGYHSSIVFSPDLKEAVWRSMDKNEGKILYSKLIDGMWTNPESKDFGIDEGILDPIFSVDGKTIYFLSFKPDIDGKNKRERIWYCDRTKIGWSDAKLIDKVVYDHPTHWTFSLAKNGTIYFMSEIDEAIGDQNIYYALFDGTKYFSPVNIGSSVNSDTKDFTPYIDPDESYLIFSRLGENTRKSDLYISFRQKDGKWSDALDMGPVVNSDTHDLAPYVSPDGKYLFFISQREKQNAIMWMSAGIIEELRPKE